MKSKVTPERLSDAQELRAAGFTYSLIAELLGVSMPLASRLANPEKRAQHNKSARKSRRQKRACIRYRARVSVRQSHYFADKHRVQPCTTPLDEIVAAYTGYCEICGREDSEDDPKFLWKAIALVVTSDDETYPK